MREEFMGEGYTSWSRKSWEESRRLRLQTYCRKRSSSYPVTMKLTDRWLWQDATEYNQDALAYGVEEH